MGRFLGQRPAQTGFTIPELMATIAILSVLIMIAVPRFQDATERGSIQSKVKQLRVSLSEARDKATTLRTVVTMCGSANGTSCDGSAFHAGWLAWADLDRDSALDANEVFMVRSGFNDESTVLATANSVTFDRNGATTATNEMRICPGSKKVQYARGIVVQQSGVVRYARDANGDGVYENNSGAAYTCP